MAYTRYNMVHRGAFLGLLALICVASAAGLPPRFADPRQVAVQESEPLCSSCTWLVKSMKCELSDIDTQDEIVRTILKDVCPKLPNEVQDICGQLAPQLIPIGVMYLQSISSKELCADAALCGTTAAASKVNYSLVQQNDLNCPMCKMVLIAIRQELRNPDSETALIEQAHEVSFRTFMQHDHVYDGPGPDKVSAPLCYIPVKTLKHAASCARLVQGCPPTGRPHASPMWTSWVSSNTLHLEVCMSESCTRCACPWRQGHSCFPIEEAYNMQATRSLTILTTWTLQPSA